MRSHMLQMDHNLSKNKVPLNPYSSNNPREGANSVFRSRSAVPSKMVARVHPGKMLTARTSKALLSTMHPHHRRVLMVLRNIKKNWLSARNVWADKEFPFHPTVIFDQPHWVHDFSRPDAPQWTTPYVFTVGRYDEHRPTMYTADLFGGTRNHHVGLDIGAPVGTAVHAFAAGSIFSISINDEEGSYGPTLITEHSMALPQRIGGPVEGEVQHFWVLYGHLSWDSIKGWKKGDSFDAGVVLAAMGDRFENGGWAPHVHVQMSRAEPVGGDLPGVVAVEDREQALQMYPDPRLICGPLY